MFIPTLLAICFLANSLASAQCPTKTRSKVSGEGLSTIFGEGASRGCEERKEECASLTQHCIPEINDELLRPPLENAKQRFCGGTLGAHCGASGGGGGEARNGDNYRGGLQRRSHGNRKNRGGDQGEEGGDDQNGPSPIPSNPPPKSVSAQAPPPQTPILSQNPSPPSASTQSQTTTPAPPAMAQLSPPPSVASTITSIITAQPTTPLQTTTTTTSQTFYPDKNNNDGCITNSGSSITMADGSIPSAYYGNWTLFCAKKAREAILSEKREPPRKDCHKCKPREIKKKRKRKRKELLCECGNMVLTEWPKEFANLLGMLEGVANGTIEKGRGGEKERGLKFPHSAKASGALGNGDFGRVVRLLGVVLGIGSAVWGI